MLQQTESLQFNSGSRNFKIMVKFQFGFDDTNIKIWQDKHTHKFKQRKNKNYNNTSLRGKHVKSQMSLYHPWALQVAHLEYRFGFLLLKHILS